MRNCGDCQLCCKLLPVREIGKLANTRCCQYQKHGKGCGVYNDTTRMRPSCKLWNCRWLVEDRTENLRGPDWTGYVIDMMPDFVTLDLGGEQNHIPVVQAWVDPARPNEWRRDKDFWNYLAKLGEEERMAALIRNGSNDAIFIAPPAMNERGTWFEHDSGSTGVRRHPDDFLKAGFGMKMEVR
jgi:hypothetical protein